MGMSGSIPLSRCGIYCGACYVYRAERDGGEFLRETAERQKVEPGEVKCNGCLAPEDQRWKNCKGCKTERCLDGMGFTFCYECGEFREGTCEYYEGLAAFCARRGEDMRTNLVKMEADLEGWLREQGEKWRCGQCGGPYSWYEESCHHCGADLGRADLRP